MTQFRKKPVVVEAFQLTDEALRTNHGWPDWLAVAWCKRAHEVGALFIVRRDYDPYFPTLLYVNTPGGAVCVMQNDWIVRGVQGELYTCDRGSFALTYEPVEEAPSDDAHRASRA